jgi:hypothetical protein
MIIAARPETTVAADTTPAPPAEKKWPPAATFALTLVLSLGLWAVIAWGIRQLVHWGLN